MKPISSNENNEKLRTMYNAIVDYHNNLVHMRFTVAGLYLAATGFLASSWFSSLGHYTSNYAIPILGLSLTGICWLLEIRTFQLTSNLGARGTEIEKKMKVNSNIGFFALMAYQPLSARLPFLRIHIPQWKPVRYVISHSFGLDLLYGAIAVFWIVVLRTT